MENLVSITSILLHRSLPAGWLVLIVLALRLALAKAPKWTRCLLWALVAVRLLCPVTLESPLSLVPEAVSGGTMPITNPDAPRDADAAAASLSPVGETSAAPAGAAETPGAAVPVVQTVDYAAEEENGAGRVLTAVWLAGFAAMQGYALLSWLRLRRRVAVSLPLRDNLRLCDAIDSPFILGLFRPRVYLPSALAEPRLSHVLAHERAHLARRDHWWKPFGFLLLSVYWFHPLLWLAYALFCRDIELACDERVLRDMAQNERVDYSQTLLDCGRAGRAIAACPLAFGETGVKERVRAALQYKKPAFWAAVGAVVVCVIAAVCLLTNPVSVKNPWTQEYTPGEGNIRGQVDTAYFENIHPDFAIGATREGYAVFKDPEKAWTAFTVLYADAIECVREANNLAPLSKATYRMYEKLGWQTESDTEDCTFVSSFLDIYENSYESLPDFEPVTRPTEPDGEEQVWVTYADFSHHGNPETILVTTQTNDPRDYQEYTVRVWTVDDAEVLYSETFDTVHPGWGALYLCHPDDGGTYLLRWLPTMYQGVATYSWELISLEDSGEARVRVGSLDFDQNDLSTIDKTLMDRFSRELNKLLDDSVLILSTLGGEVKFGTAGSEDEVNVYAEAVDGLAWPFTGVLGYDGYYNERELGPWHYERVYYAQTDSAAVEIAHSFGFDLDDDARDLDGDGVTELICNCVYGGDGAARVVVYRNRDGVLERGQIDYDLLSMPGWDDESAGSTHEVWNAARGEFWITYALQTGGAKMIRMADLSGFVFEAF